MQPPFYGRFVILIYGNNLYHTLRELQFHVDYRQILVYFLTCGTLIRAHYFTALLDAPLTPDWLVQLIDWLSYNGFKVHTKRAKSFERRVINEFGEESYIQEVKSSVEMEMTVEALQARAQFLIKALRPLLPPVQLRVYAPYHSVTDTTPLYLFAFVMNELLLAGYQIPPPVT